MVYVYGPYLETTHLQGLAGRKRNHLRVVYSVLAQFIVYKREREFSARDGDFEFFQQIRNSAYMVFVSVRENKPAHPLRVFDEIGYIGNDKVESGGFFRGEDCARIDYDNVVAAFDCGHILSYFANAAEIDDFYGLDRALDALCGFALSGRALIYLLLRRHA